MPFPMKIQPIDFNTLEEAALPRSEIVKPLVKSRFKRLFERPFPSVLRNSTTDKIGTVAADELPLSKECAGEFEPSSVCLAKMVQNFIEENEKQQSCAVRCSRNRCNCFNRNCSDSSEDDMDSFFGDSNLNSPAEASEILKNLICPMSVSEKILLADTAKIVEKNKICKSKDDFCRKMVTDGLLTLGYDASICKSSWEKSPSCPAGEYEYIDVIIEGERMLIDIDFRSEFELARSTKTYKSILQMLPFIFVGKADRLQKIIVTVSEALDPKAKEQCQPLFELNPEGKNSVDDADLGEPMFALSESSEEERNEKNLKEEERKPPQINPRSSQIGVKIVAGVEPKQRGKGAEELNFIMMEAASCSLEHCEVAIEGWSHLVALVGVVGPLPRDFKTRASVPTFS
ncbi:Bifunctional DNA-directed RNA polymerase subunit beta-beta' [Gossypium australe]|uniref:Bifunctional DNA-directed RNA polymerase subunit beta-beta n=1 Tax=Gossypium australe TaxID=47621 RepID=A0A5B6VQ51_9ROSI|nr:Bifunctional DNA-directed RNA polymerase subunit beta-beta' [Gossypium australe]